MNDNKNILEGANHDDGMVVPPGYFADFKQKMAQSLPARPELQAPVLAPRSRWQRLRPYVYLAAMFGGIWCMLKLFTMLTATTSTPIESNPIIAEALANEQFVNEYVLRDLSQWDLYDELIDSCIYPDSLCGNDLSQF